MNLKMVRDGWAWRFNTYDKKGEYGDAREEAKEYTGPVGRSSPGPAVGVPGREAEEATATGRRCTSSGP